MSWDETGSPHPLALRRTGRSEQEPDRLPEVRELGALGWEPAPEANLWTFLPYVWPPEARTWVPDRGTRWVVETRLDGHGHILAVDCAPLPEEDLELLEAEAADILSALGLPPRPRGRLWLLRPVGPHLSLASLLDHLAARAKAHALPLTPTPDLLALTAEELTTLSTLPPATPPTEPPPA